MPPSLIADRYHVLRELGRGGMGVVYQVLDKETGEQHALKVLLAHKSAKGDSVERFKRELKLPARIQSDHVVQVFDSGEVREEDGAPFYVMELLRGCDLRKLLDTKHVFTAQEIIWILRQLAHGLSKAHEIGIVHRDLKPDNIFLHCRDDESLVVKLLDFGIARYAQELLETGDQQKLTATQAMLGTPLYMAPEQAKGGEGRAEIGPCTDVWAMGMIVFELLTGKTYWTANSVVAHLGQLLFGTMVSPSERAPELPRGFDAWFSRSCNRDSSKRYPSIGEQIGDLTSLLAKAAVGHAPPSALLAAVKARMPPMVDHGSPTLLAGIVQQRGAGPVPFRETEDGETHIFEQNKLLRGSTEQNLRAEIFPGPQAKQQPGSAGPGKLKLRALLGGAVLLGVGTTALVIMRGKPGPVPGSAMMSADMAAEGGELTPRMDLSAPPDLEPAPHPGHAPSIRKPPPDPKRPKGPKGPKGPKAEKPAAPDETPTKPRRTYIPPNL